MTIISFAKSLNFSSTETKTKDRVWYEARLEVIALSLSLYVYVNYK